MTAIDDRHTQQELMELCWFELRQCGPSLAEILGTPILPNSYDFTIPRKAVYTSPKDFFDYNATLLMLLLCFEFDEDLSNVESCE